MKYVENALAYYPDIWNVAMKGILVWVLLNKVNVVYY
jgi:hypothetical protein